MMNKVLKSQSGFTLIELLAVMAIIGILAAVVMTETTGAQSAGDVAANQQSGSALDSAVVDFVADQVDAESISSATVTVTATINDDAAAPTTQRISSRHPEKFITSNDTGASSTAIYGNEFPTFGATTDGVVVNVVLIDRNGSPISRVDFLEVHTAIDVTLLEELGFLSDTLESATSTVNDTFHNFLWTFAKIGSSDGGDLDARRIEAFKLVKITEVGELGPGSTLPGAKTVELEYEQFF